MKKHIHSRRVARLLEEKGHKIVDTEKNKKIEKYDIYIFEVDETFFEDLTSITEEIRKEK